MENVLLRIKVLHNSKKESIGYVPSGKIRNVWLVQIDLILIARAFAHKLTLIAKNFQNRKKSVLNAIMGIN